MDTATPVTPKPKAPETAIMKAGRVYDQLSRLSGAIRRQETPPDTGTSIQDTLEALGRGGETPEIQMIMAATVTQFVVAVQIANMEETTAANKARIADIAAELLTQCKRLLSTAYPVGF